MAGDPATAIVEYRAAAARTASSPPTSDRSEATATAIAVADTAGEQEHEQDDQQDG
jgi:hypothetical protein